MTDTVPRNASEFFELSIIHREISFSVARVVFFFTRRKVWLNDSGESSWNILFPGMNIN